MQSFVPRMVPMHASVGFRHGHALRTTQQKLGQQTLNRNSCVGTRNGAEDFADCKLQN